MGAVIWAILRSRVGQVILAILAGVLIYNLWVHHLHGKWAAAEKGKAAVEVLQKTDEVKKDADERKEAVEKMGPDDLINYWGGDRVRPDDPKGGAPAPPR